MQQIISANKIFTGTAWLSNHSIIIEDEMIVDIIPTSQINQSTNKLINYSTLVPSFIDIQIYGAHGKLLAVYPEADSLFELYDY